MAGRSSKGISARVASVGWAALLAMAVAWLWGRASTRVTVQGG